MGPTKSRVNNLGAEPAEDVTSQENEGPLCEVCGLGRIFERDGETHCPWCGRLRDAFVDAMWQAKWELEHDAIQQTLRAVAQAMLHALQAGHYPDWFGDMDPVFFRLVESLAAREDVGLYLLLQKEGRLPGRLLADGREVE